MMTDPFFWAMAIGALTGGFGSLLLWYMRTRRRRRPWPTASLAAQWIHQDQALQRMKPVLQVGDIEAKLLSDQGGMVRIADTNGIRHVIMTPTEAQALALWLIALAGDPPGPSIPADSVTAPRPAG